MEKTADELNNSRTNFYVPPYLLSISDQFLRFEDCTDGSSTMECIKQDAEEIHTDLMASENVGDWKVEVPDAVTEFCRKERPDVDLDHALYQNQSNMKVPYLLSAFGWSVSNEPDEENAGIVAKCNMCHARSLLGPSSAQKDEETPSRKKRRVDASLNLINSHRVYCPYRSGFSFGPGHQSERPGWKVVVSNVLKLDSQNPVKNNLEMQH